MEINDVRTIVNNIDDFVELPDGIERLREVVLVLAISGQLVPRGSQPWESLTLGKVCKTRKGKKPELFETKNKERLPYLEARFIRGAVKPKFAQISDKNSVVVTANDLIIICDGSNSGEFFIGIEGVLASTMALLDFDRKRIQKAYMQLFLKSNFKRFNNAKKGAAIPHLDFNIFNSLEFSLPPITEQKRIVERVETIMKQLDELEARKKERDAVRTRLTQNAMRALGEGTTELALRHLAELIKTPSDLKELEGAILALAISGHLTPQDEKDGVADTLFRQIQSKRVKTKKRIEVEDKDELFPIPSNWLWVRLEDVFDVRDGTHDSPKYHPTGYPLVTSKNLYYGTLDFLNVKYVSEADHEKISARSRVDRDDILLAMIGSIGNPAIVDTDTEFSIKNVALFKYYDRKLSEPMFLLAYLKYVSKKMRAVSAGGVQSFVSLGFLRGYPFPLPPLAEQKRIVRAINNVRPYLNEIVELL